jgi:cysteinyl-tRNA synthetase
LPVRRHGPIARASCQARTPPPPADAEPPPRRVPALQHARARRRAVRAGDGRTVTLYTCGPTVYNPAHLGNFRTFLFEDLLRRALRLAGFGVTQVMNLTDVDDKIIRRADEQGKTIGEVTDPVVDVFHADREFLRIERAEHYPRRRTTSPR